MNKFLAFFAVLILLMITGLYFVFQVNAPEEPGLDTSLAIDTNPKFLNRISLVCNEGKTIDAAFYQTAATTSAGQAPITTGSVRLVLSDGRSLELQQTVSVDGARYANAGDAFVFLSKGNGALITENNKEESYKGCVLVAPTAVGVNLPSVYADKEGSFSLRLPSLASATSDGYKIDELFTRVVTSKKSIDGVRFTIPASMATGTNLSADSYLSVENIPNATSSCIASFFLDDVNGTTTVSDGGVAYFIASSSGAAAGNRYEETAYTLSATNPCVTVHYFIHYTAFENYASGTVKEFSKSALTTEFDQIRRSLRLNQ